VSQLDSAYSVVDLEAERVVAARGVRWAGGWPAGPARASCGAVARVGSCLNNA